MNKELQLMEEQGVFLCEGHLLARCNYCPNCLADDFNKLCVFYRQVEKVNELYETENEFRTA